jgi:antitoxin component YwqK of YwqJK toxin-antitoxin module
MISFDIYYMIGLKINIPNDFFNFILAVKNITNKELLISLKKKQFIKEINEEIENIGKECYYKLPNGKEEGLYQSWYNNGQLMEKYSYINGKKEGLYQLWYDNGQLHKRYNFINNEVEGLYQSWYDDGNLGDEGKYINGKKEGLYKSWYNNGQLYEECKYINDKKVA